MTAVIILQKFINLTMDIDIRKASEHGEDQGLGADERAVCEALAENASEMEMLSNGVLKLITKLLTGLQKRVSMDWSHREGVRARIQVLVKCILRKHVTCPTCKISWCRRSYGKRRNCRSDGHNKLPAGSVAR